MSVRLQLYAVWHAMHDRCKNPSNPRWHRYGGRGVRVCAEWETFNPFVEWAADKHAPGLQIDRKDNSGDYSPDNCRFVTCATNNQNREFVKLNAEKVATIKRRLIDGENAKDLANELHRGALGQQRPG